MAIFGAIALVGLLGASIMTFMKGPLSTSVRLTKMNTAENQMSIGAQVAVMATASQANNGDCELIDPDGAGPLPPEPDGFVEPIAFRTPTTEPVPTGGGLVPSTLGISKKDPWGTEYGYCVWNHGPSTAGNGCDANMLAGTNSRAYPVVALISAGPDKAFTTTCRDFSVADVTGDGDLLDATDLPLFSKAAETDDDIITSFTYEEATGASGGLWSLKAGEPGTAVIGKNIEATGIADLKGGVLLPDKSFIDCTDVANTGVMAKSALGIEICDGAGAWTSIGGASGALSTSATCAAPADAGNVRFNSVSGQPEFCNGTAWLPFTINTPGVNLVITPNNQTAMNVDGTSNQDTSTCTPASGMSCGASISFTITNQGTLTSSVPSIRIVQIVNGATQTILGGNLTLVTNNSNFVALSNTCTTTLAPNATCVVVIRPKANGNTSYTADLRVIADNNPMAIMQGTSTNFGCVAGRQAGGGRYAACNLTDPDTGAVYDLVVQPSGCSGAANNPTCTGGTDTYRTNFGSGCCNSTQGGEFSGWTGGEMNGARNSVDIMQVSTAKGYLSTAVAYCMNLNLNGYTDWYLPARQEMTSLIFPSRSAIGGFQADWYWTSCYGWNSDACLSNMNDGSWTGDGINSTRWLRCARRDNIPLPSEKVYNNPAAITIAPTVSLTSPFRATSSTFTVNGVTVPITVSISGAAGDPKLKVNGGPEVSTATVTAGQAIQFIMDTPAILGTKNTATVNWGPTKTYTWWVGYADSSKVAKVFVTSNLYMGGWIGGLSGADNQCNWRASVSTLGLSGAWKAILSNSSTSAASRIPWNWGRLETVTGTTVATSLANLFSGSFSSPINIDEFGTARSYSVWTGSSSSGANFYPGQTVAQYWAYDWTASNCCGYSPATYGLSTSIGNAFYQGTRDSDNQHALYCIEDIDNTADTTPAAISPAYTIQAPLSTRQMTPVTKIAGMSNGATTTLSVSAPSGNPTFTINGGAEVTSGTVRNGDDIIFYLDAPATASTSIMMTITSSAPATTLGYWRVWSGWDGIGTGIKRVFVTSTDPSGSGFGGVTGADTHCQSRASAAALGGTWRAIISSTNELAWAVNRVGYNWNELRLVDGTTVVAYAPNLWSGLLNPIIKTEFGATRGSTRILSGTASNGKSYSSVADLSNLFNWTGAQCSATYMQGNSSALTAGISQGYWLCQSDGALFCIEQ